MPNVTVTVVGGMDEENLAAITVGARRWGTNGASWGTTQNLPPGKDTQVRAYYGQSKEGSIIAYFDLEEGNVTLEITADGPDVTPIEILDE